MNDQPKQVPMVQPAPAMALGESLMRLLADPNIPADKLQVLLQMQKDIMADSRREQFQAAFAAMTPQLPQVDRRGVVELIKEGKSFGSYKYAKWEHIDEVLRPIYSSFGFSLSFSQRIDNGKAVLVGKLMHTGGHFEMSERVLTADPGPGRNPAQAEGSGLSYAKRYMAEGLLNIVRRDEDDDAVTARLQPCSPEQVKVLAKLLADTKTSQENFLTMFVTAATKLEEIPARDFVRLQNALLGKLQAVASKGKQK